MADYLHPRELGDGLVLRWATERDVERVAHLTSHVFRDAAEEPPSESSTAWMRDLGSGRHPFTGVERCILVDDTRADKVVASMWLIPVTWSYGGIPFRVGRPEEVASDPDYRRRGLVRAMFEAFHARSAADGEIVQAITGIPYYYRQFGYEYALDLGGGRSVSFDDIPQLKDGQEEPFRLVPADEDDLPFVKELYQQEHRRSLVSAEIPIEYWRWMLDGINHQSGGGWKALLIVDKTGQRRGYVLPQTKRWGSTSTIRGVEVSPGVSLHEVVPSALRGLQAFAPTVLMGGSEPKPVNRLVFGLGAEHPLYDVLGNALAPRRSPPYAWYVRVADLPGLIRHIAPALEQRFEGSAAGRYSGELRLDFYRGGLRLVFEGGRLSVAEEWQKPVWKGEPSAGFPPLVFLQLLFGRRSLDELRYAYPDVWVSDQAELVLNTLFSKRYSHVMELN